MRVLVNELTAIRQKAGIGHYIAELLAGLRTQAHGDTIVTYPGPLVRAGMVAWKKLRSLCSSPKVRGTGHDSPWKTRVHALSRRMAGWHFRAFGARRAFDLYHEPNLVPLLCDRPTVTTVHDLSVLLHPQWHSADRVAYFEKNFGAGLERSTHLLAISEFTRQELIRHFHVPRSKVTVTHMGVRPGLGPMTPAEIAPVRRRLGLPDDFLLHVGTLEPRKNLLMLMKAYVSLPDSVRARCPLVLVGGWGWNVGGLASYLNEVARHRGVMHLGYVPDKDLAAVYGAARALVFPTFYEGFGMPPVEMLACGGAVLASTAGAVVEILGVRAPLLDPDDQDSWRAAMLRIIEDEDWRTSLRHGAREAARQFTWERCAETTWQVYRSVAGEKAALARAA